MPEEKRVQIDISSDTRGRLERLKAEIGSTTRAQIIRDALRVYSIFAMLNDNDTVELIDQNGNVLFHGRAILLK